MRAHVAVLGGTCAVTGTSGQQTCLTSPRQRGLLLVLATGQPASRTASSLKAQLWSRPPRDIDNGLHCAVRTLRRHLDDHYQHQILQLRGGLYQLNPNTHDSDWRKFNALRDQAENAEPSVALNLLNEALSLWSPSGLPGPWPKTKGMSKFVDSLYQERINTLIRFTQLALTQPRLPRLQYSMMLQILDTPNISLARQTMNYLASLAPYDTDARDAVARARQWILRIASPLIVELVHPNIQQVESGLPVPAAAKQTPATYSQGQTSQPADRS